MRTAHVTDAGLLPPEKRHIAVRKTTSLFRPIVQERKDGWISLDWEHNDGHMEQRTILVTRERALQAMMALNQGARLV